MLPGRNSPIWRKFRGSTYPAWGRLRGSAVRCFATALAVTALALPAASLARQPTPQTSLPDVEDEVMCTICGVTLELATDAPQALREREYIRTLIARGLTKDEI